MTTLKCDINELTFQVNDESKEFDILSTDGASWSIVKGSYPEWLDIKKEGNKVIVTAKKYTGNKRNGEFTVVSGNAKKTFLVYQYGAGATLSIDATTRSYYFKKEAKTISIKLNTNTQDWTVQPLNNVSWLEWKRDVKNQSLTLMVSAFEKTDKDYRTNRKATLYISSGNKHIKLHITQAGWVQFGDPIFFPKGTLRTKVLEEEGKLGHTRVLEYDKKFWPKDEAGDKQFMGVTNDGEQVAMTVYGFDGNENEMFDGIIYLKPKEGESFDEEIFKEAMIYKGFKEGSLPSYNAFFGHPTLAYYKEGSSHTYIYTLYNGDDAKIHNWDRGPFISCKLASNNLELEGGEMKNFPVRNTSSMDDPNYKLEEIIAYEKSQGLEPDYDDTEFTKLNKTYPQVKYTSLAFKPITPTEEDGKLFKVIYTFNYPGVDEGGDSRFLSGDPELAGSFGRRYDIYNGRKYSLQKDGAGFDVLRRGVARLAREKGYDVLRQDFGWITLWRGLNRTDVTQDKEFIDVTSGRVKGKDKTTFDYYKTKIALEE